MKRLTLTIATAVGILGTSALFAQMNMDGMDMGHSQHQHSSETAQSPLPEPAKTVFAYYLKIQVRLAQDELHTSQQFRALKENATVIAESARKDSAQTFSPDVANQADALAKATDLKAAREAFKPLSESLIQYLGTHKEFAGQFVAVYCSMANAKWLQNGTVVSNPYLGKEMPTCGQIIQPKAGASSGSEHHDMSSSEHAGMADCNMANMAGCGSH